MSPFERLTQQFVTNWTTILAGWRGLGVFSPWPAPSHAFPPLLSADELAAYANEHLASSCDVAEEDLIVSLLSLDLHTESRDTIIDPLARLSDLRECDPSREVRKWRLVLLEDMLGHIPNDPLYGLTALTEFWQNFGFPSDSPHEVQGKASRASPADDYQESNYVRLLSRHQASIEKEKAELRVERKKGMKRGRR